MKEHVSMRDSEGSVGLQTITPAQGSDNHQHIK